MIYLKADTEQALIEALPQFRNEDGWRLATHDYALDVVGDIIDSPAEYDDEGNTISEQTYFDGFHANLECTIEITSTLPEEIQIIVNNPKRRFANDTN